MRLGNHPLQLQITISPVDPNVSGALSFNLPINDTSKGSAHIDLDHDRRGNYFRGSDTWKRININGMKPTSGGGRVSDGIPQEGQYWADIKYQGVSRRLLIKYKYDNKKITVTFK